MRIVFIGTGEIGVPVLRSLLKSTEHQLVGVVTQPDKPVGREQRIAGAADQGGAGRRARFRFFNRRESSARRRSRKFAR